MCLLRFSGWPPKRRERVHLSLLAYLCEQLEIKTNDVEEYFRRQPTRSDHLKEIIDLYCYRSYDKQVGEGWERNAIETAHFHLDDRRSDEISLDEIERISY